MLSVLELVRQAPQFAGVPVIGYKSSEVQKDEALLTLLSQNIGSFTGLQEIWIGSAESAAWYAKYFGRSEVLCSTLSVRSYEEP
jgi:hypothetical protein